MTDALIAACGSQVQANSAKLAKEVPTLAGKHVVVCVIDSGLYSKHEDLSKGVSMNGCKVQTIILMLFDNYCRQQLLHGSCAPCALPSPPSAPCLNRTTLLVQLVPCPAVAS